jgi:hypothetical protein
MSGPCPLDMPTPTGYDENTLKGHAAELLSIPKLDCRRFIRSQVEQTLRALVEAQSDLAEP